MANFPNCPKCHDNRMVTGISTSYVCSRCGSTFIPDNEVPKCACGMKIAKGGSLGHCPKCKCRFVGSLCYGPPCHCKETKHLTIDLLIGLIEGGMNPEEEVKFLFEQGPVEKW